METIESLGYLKGLLDGLDLDESKKETKAIRAIVDVLNNIVEDIDDVTEGMELLAEQIDAVDEDLEAVEDYLSDDDDFDCDCDCCDDDCDCEEMAVFGVECPYCGIEFDVDEDTVLEEGHINCPNCGELLELEVEFDECECEDCEEQN